MAKNKINEKVYQEISDCIMKLKYWREGGESRINHYTYLRRGFIQALKDNSVPFEVVDSILNLNADIMVESMFHSLLKKPDTPQCLQFKTSEGIVYYTQFLENGYHFDRVLERAQEVVYGVGFNLNQTNIPMKKFNVKTQKLLQIGFDLRKRYGREFYREREADNLAGIGLLLQITGMGRFAEDFIKENFRNKGYPIGTINIDRDRGYLRFRITKWDAPPRNPLEDSNLINRIAICPDVFGTIKGEYSSLSHGYSFFEVKECLERKNPKKCSYFPIIGGVLGGIPGLEILDLPNPSKALKVLRLACKYTFEKEC